MGIGKPANPKGVIRTKAGSTFKGQVCGIRVQVGCTQQEGGCRFSQAKGFGIGAGS